MAKAQNIAAVYVDPTTLSPWDENPRNNSEAVGKVAKSIERFGFASPIIARKKDGRVIAGHTRLKAALRLNMDEVPVRFMDLDDQASAALALADNRLGEVATWDDDMLKSILDDLAADGVDVQELGFDEDDFARLADEIMEDLEEPEIVFSEYLDEANNYVVLFFDNSVDWLQAQTHFELKSVHSKRANGKPWSKGIGRVLNGAEYLKKVTG